VGFAIAVDPRLGGSLGFHSRMKPEPLFYIQGEGQEVAGPYDLVQMAGLLRKKIIAGETPARLEGSEDWKPFSWHPQFMVAREMPAGAVSQRQAALEEKARASSSPIPLPSAETLLKLAGVVVGSLVAGAAAYFIARMDEATGYCLGWAGGGVAAVATVLIVMRVLQEDLGTIFLVLFIPFGDIFYFMLNIWKYLGLFAAKYIGGAVCFGALVGLAAHK
jgi:hypothetical protein